MTSDTEKAHTDCPVPSAGSRFGCHAAQGGREQRQGLEPAAPPRPRGWTSLWRPAESVSRTRCFCTPGSALREGTRVAPSRRRSSYRRPCTQRDGPTHKEDMAKRRGETGNSAGAVGNSVPCSQLGVSRKPALAGLALWAGFWAQAAHRAPLQAAKVHIGLESAL